MAISIDNNSNVSCLDKSNSNSTDDYNFTELNVISLSLLKSQKIPFILWILFGSLNIVGSILVILTILYNKTLHNATNYLVANLALSDIVYSLSGVYVGAMHLYNIYFEIPEVITRTQCFARTVFTTYFITLTSLLYLALSCDRFTASIIPMYYKDRHRYTNQIAAGVLWLIVLILTILSYLDKSDIVNKELYLVICLSRESTSERMYKILLYILLLCNVFSVLIYVLIIAILKLKLIFSKNAGGANNSSINEIRSRMTNKVTQSLAINCFIHFFTVMFHSLGSVVVADLPYRGAYYSSYLGVLSVFSGTTNFLIYFICQQQFNEGFRNLFQRFLTSSTTDASKTWGTRTRTNCTRGIVPNATT